MGQRLTRTPAGTEVNLRPRVARDQGQPAGHENGGAGDVPAIGAGGLRVEWATLFPNPAR